MGKLSCIPTRGLSSGPRLSPDIVVAVRVAAAAVLELADGLLSVTCTRSEPIGTR